FLAASGAGANADAFLRWQRGRVDEGPPRLRMQPVDSFAFVSPGDLAERFAVDERAVLPIQAVEVAVAVRLHQRLHRLAVLLDIDQYGLVDAVIIPDIVRAGLEVPLVGAIVRIEGND